MQISSRSFLAWIMAGYILSLNAYYLLVPGGFGQTSFVDEMFALALSPFAAHFVLHANKRMRLVIILFGGYFAVLSVSSLFQAASGAAGAPWQAPVLGILLDIKPLFFVFGLMFFYERLHSDSRNSALTQVSNAIVVVGLLNAAFALVQISTGSSPTITGGLQASLAFGYVPVGLFGHKVQAATLMAVALLCSCALYAESKGGRYLLAAWIFTIVLLACNSAKELVALPLGAFVIFRSLPRGKSWRPNILRVVLLLAAPTLVFVGWLVVQDLLLNRAELYLFGTSVRGLMHQVSTQIARDYFPLGSGAGTFGSAPSRDLYYSNLYHLYGLSSHYGASPQYSSYLMDTWWPKVLGETGLFGAALYAMALLVPLGIAWNSYARVPSLSNTLSWTGLALLLCTALASAVFNSDHGMLIWGLSFMALATLPRKKPVQRSMELPAAPPKASVGGI